MVFPIFATLYLGDDNFNSLALRSGVIGGIILVSALACARG
jgi:hypothetical protein